MKIVLDKGAIMPERAHRQDAGLDLFSPEDVMVKPRASALIDTGVHVEIPPFCVGFLRSKSGLMVNHQLTSDGTIDEGYTGSIRVMLINHSDWYYRISRGDKITQLVIVPVIRPEIEVVDKLDETDRGDSGFGSTGR